MARTSHSCSSINTTLLLYSDITIHQFGVAFSVLVLIIRLYLVTSWASWGAPLDNLKVTFLSRNRFSIFWQLSSSWRCWSSEART